MWSAFGFGLCSSWYFLQRGEVVRSTGDSKARPPPCHRRWTELRLSALRGRYAIVGGNDDRGPSAQPGSTRTAGFLNRPGAQRAPSSLHLGGPMQATAASRMRGVGTGRLIDRPHESEVGRATAISQNRISRSSKRRSDMYRIRMKRLVDGGAPRLARMRCDGQPRAL